MYYGLANKKQIVDCAKLVCDVIGHGSNKNAITMLIETCAAETLLGECRDRTLYGAGAGVTQVDEGTFVWLKAKYSSRSVATDIYNKLNIKLDLVVYSELDNSPMLSLIFARLRYWTVVAPIPLDLKSRAVYWKKFYNTRAGKGSVEEYLERCETAQTKVLLLTRKSVA